MLMPKKNRIAIYEHLFKEGVMVAKKDFHAAKHPEIESVPNLHVIKALQVRILFGFGRLLVGSSLLCHLHLQPITVFYVPLVPCTSAITNHRIQ